LVSSAHPEQFDSSETPTLPKEALTVKRAHFIERLICEETKGCAH
jgi:hypothetical protein